LCFAKRGSKWKDRYRAVLLMKTEKTVRMKKRWDWAMRRSLVGCAIVSAGLVPSRRG
jgi:hypothetical protein